ncbi:MAG: hypothetical protein BIFFINMI_00194 [Phycisphaerae bacterium]|nr:hypothetical protein [Phycisphaerae bacterium]
MLVHRPAVYEHAAALIGRLPAEVFADADLLVEAHQAAHERYGLSHVVVATDIYGADVTALSGELDGRLTLEQAAALDPGRFPAGPQRNILSAARRLAERIGQAVTVQVPVVGPLSLATQLAGFETVLMTLIDGPERVAAALDRLAEVQCHYIARVPAGCGVTIFESAAAPPLVPPRDFERLAAGRLEAMMDQARAVTGRAAELIMGGHTEKILPHLLALSPALLICDPVNDARRFLADCRAAGADLRVNLPANYLLPDHRIEAHQALENLARLARGEAALYVATGVVPFDARTDDVNAFSDLVAQVNEAV